MFNVMGYNGFDVSELLASFLVHSCILHPQCHRYPAKHVGIFATGFFFTNATEVTGTFQTNKQNARI